MNTPATLPKHRLHHHFACLEAAELGKECAIAGLPLDPNCLSEPDEQEAYEREWRYTTAQLAATGGTIAQTRATLDMSDPQPASLWSRLWRWLRPGVSPQPISKERQAWQAK